MESKREKVAIIGAGPAGCMCAYFAQKQAEVTLFDSKSPLHTLLYTGGGRCNLAYAEYDFRELAKFYPRGEKFLYSVFSKFCTGNTIDFFEKIGVKTYTQDDFRIFPISNSAKDVRGKFLNNLKKCTIKNTKVIKINKNNNKFEIKTQDNNYHFDKVVIAVGGHAGFELAKNLGHKIITPKPALTGLTSRENFKSIQGLSLQNINAEISFQEKKFPPQTGDLIFTHEGISGPLAYKISSIFAREDYNKTNPLILRLKLLSEDINLQDLLNSNSQKDIKNLIAEFTPKSLAEYIAKTCQCANLKCHQINGEKRNLLLGMLTNFEINITGHAKEGEVVTSGGVDLNEIDAKTMQSKLVENLYFCGEVIDVDGLCGGFNLQNCWSTGYIAGIFLG